MAPSRGGMPLTKNPSMNTLSKRNSPRANAQVPRDRRVVELVDVVLVDQQPMDGRKRSAQACPHARAPIAAIERQASQMPARDRLCTDTAISRAARGRPRSWC